MTQEKPIDNAEYLSKIPRNEQQETDPMVRLEKVAIEFGTNAGKLDGLLKSEGGIDSLPPKESEKFSEFKNNLISKSEKLKDMLTVAGIVIGGTALAMTGGIGLEELRQSMEISKELMLLGLGSATLIAGMIAIMQDNTPNSDMIRADRERGGPFDELDRLKRKYGNL